MRRLCGILAAALAFGTIAAPAGAQEPTAPEEATLGLCTAHFEALVLAPAEAPGISVAHEEVLEPTGTCP